MFFFHVFRNWTRRLNNKFSDELKKKRPLGSYWVIERVQTFRNIQTSKIRSKSIHISILSPHRNVNRSFHKRASIKHDDRSWKFERFIDFTYSKSFRSHIWDLLASTIKQMQIESSSRMTRLKPSATHRVKRFSGRRRRRRRKPVRFDQSLGRRSKKMLTGLQIGALSLVVIADGAVCTIDEAFEVYCCRGMWRNFWGLVGYELRLFVLEFMWICWMFDSTI